MGGKDTIYKKKSYSLKEGKCNLVIIRIYNFGQPLYFIKDSLIARVHPTHLDNTF